MAKKHLRKAMRNLAKGLLILFMYPILFLMFPLSVKTGICGLILLVMSGLFVLFSWQVISFFENISIWLK